METDGFGPKGLSPSIVYRLSSIIYPSNSRSYTTSGFAAVGILMTLSPKRASASTQGSFLGKELPTGLRLADEIWPAGPVLIYPSNSRTASHRLSDSIAAHRLSHPKPHPFPQAPRYTKSSQALPAVIPAGNPWAFSILFYHKNILPRSGRPGPKRKAAALPQLHRNIGSQTSPVISSGGKYRNDAAFKNRYSFEESRNLSNK